MIALAVMVLVPVVYGIYVFKFEKYQPLKEGEYIAPPPGLL